jgi:hypothetical protein
MPKPVEATKEAKKKNGDEDCQDPEKKCPKKEEKQEDHEGNDFKVPKGQQTFDSEGKENPGGKNHSRVAHWPGGSSGVTLGRGYDMKNRKPAAVERDLIGAGVPADVAKQYSAGGGLPPSQAKTWVANNAGSIPEISPSAQKRLFMKTYDFEEGEVERISGKADTVDEYGATCWKNLDPKIKQGATDLKFRGDYNTNSRTFLQKHIANNDVEGFANEIRNKSNWPNVPDQRFNERVDFFNK